MMITSHIVVLLFHRRLGVELGKSVVFQESNRGEERLKDKEGRPDRYLG